METGNTLITMLESAITIGTSAVSAVWEFAVTNPLLSAFVGLSLLGTGIGLFASLKQSV